MADSELMSFAEAVQFVIRTYNGDIRQMIAAHESFGSSKEDNFKKKLIKITILAIVWRKTGGSDEMRLEIQQLWDSLDD